MCRGRTISNISVAHGKVLGSKQPPRNRGTTVGCRGVAGVGKGEVIVGLQPRPRGGVGAKTRSTSKQRPATSSVPGRRI